MAKLKKYLCAFLIIFFLIITFKINMTSLSGNDLGSKVEEEIIYSSSNTDYYSYKAKNSTKNALSTININILNVSSGSTGYLVKENYIQTEEKSFVEWTFTVQEAGNYNLYIKYIPLEGNGLSIQRRMKIDNQYLFDEMSLLSFNRLWHDSEAIKNENGNEIRPLQEEVFEFVETYVGDATKIVSEYFMFNLEKGEHTLSFEAVREPFAIYELSFKPVVEIKKYEDVLKDYEEQGLKEIENINFTKYQAENATFKSSSSIYAISDNTSKFTENYLNKKNHVYQIRLNLLGGTNWSNASDYVEWEIVVENEGLYALSFKFLQDNKADLASIRTLYINGMIPFEECRSIEFEYTKKFKLKTIGDENGAFLFHLKKGKNTIRLETSLGKYAIAITLVKGLIERLNAIYREIIVVTGASPDSNTDYQLTKYIPNLIPDLTNELENIDDILIKIASSSDKKSEETIALNKLRDQIKDFIQNPYDISLKLSLFNSNISSLGTCLNNLMTQPLKLDYLGYHSVDLEKNIKVKENFIGKLWFEIKKLFVSFFVDYDSLGSGTKGSENIEVWILTGRDQAQVVKNLAVNSFSSVRDIGVTVKLVPSSALLPNTLIGNGPDVVLMVGNDIPAQYAFRNAAYDLSVFPDLEEFVNNNFYESAMTNLRYEGGVYGLPETISFPVLYYREDILAELKIDVPNTWDELLLAMIELQNYNMGIYLGQPSSVTNVSIDTVYSSLLYQSGGDFYNDHGVTTALNSEIAINTFIKWSQFYTKFGVPLSANFTNRFRSGDMPIGISGYSLYNTLTMSAPEIQGKWKMALLPGTIQDNGEIDRSCMSSGNAAMILKQTKYPDASWEFIKWWVSTETQTAYGREIESILGPSARYDTANVNAIKQIPWTQEERDIILEQYSYVKGFEQVPGGYMTGRQLSYAFRAVVNNNTNPRETLLEYSQYINTELRIKRKEFGLE